MRRDLVGLVRRLGIGEGAGRGAAFRTKEEGLRMSLVMSLEPLDRLAKAEGSTFSKSSVSISSAFRLPVVVGAADNVSDDQTPATSPHTILPILETCERLKSRPIERSKWLTSDSSHGYDGKRVELCEVSSCLFIVIA